MDLSMKWLADYVDCDMPIKDFVSALTLSGSKVECFEQEGEDISNVVVGKVVSMERHPDSDHMFITQVDVGRACSDSYRCSERSRGRFCASCKAQVICSP